jgi:large subunit ribosomal protein L22|tara:strand:+ start:4229 stop:4924 length:696 start_codon:yes stop_codon:yes gene_type:complete
MQEEKQKIEEKKEEKVVETPKQKAQEIEEKKKIVENKETKIEEKPSKEEEKKEETKDTEKTEEKKPVQTKPKVKKTEAFVNATSLPISTKHSMAVCKFIKGKKIEDALKNLEEVVLIKKAVPMKGEIPHRKGMMSGRYPKKTAEYFIKLLKGLSANANVNGLENPVISEAIANMASRPYSRFGRVRKKRTHVKIIVKEKPSKKESNKPSVKKDKSKINTQTKPKENLEEGK